MWTSLALMLSAKSLLDFQAEIVVGFGTNAAQLCRVVTCFCCVSIGCGRCEPITIVCPIFSPPSRIGLASTCCCEAASCRSLAAGPGR